MKWISPTAAGAVLSLRVVPRASQNRVVATPEELRVRLQSPPVDGKANRALVEFLAETLDLPRSSVAILSGLTGRSKRVLLRGVPPAEAERRLMAPSDA